MYGDGSKNCIRDLRVRNGLDGDVRHTQSPHLHNDKNVVLKTENDTRKNNRDIKNFTIITIIYHMSSCEWWRSNSGSTPSLLITCHMTSYGKNCKIFYIPRIALILVLHHY